LLDFVDGFGYVPSERKDMVNNPAHYNRAGVEVIDVIEAYHPDSYHLGNALKYLCRAPYKGHLREDLLKCIWYINRFLEGHDDSVANVSPEQGNS
jgi:hypothetical protein